MFSHPPCWATLYPSLGADIFQSICTQYLKAEEITVFVHKWKDLSSQKPSKFGHTCTFVIPTLLVWGHRNRFLDAGKPASLVYTAANNK